MFKWKPGVTSQQIDHATREINALRVKIPGMTELSFGANVSPRSLGYTHGGVMKFTDRAALDAYNPHPDHQKILELLRPLLAEAAELDYET